ncbi:MAG: sugar ABC transporter permease [Clostridia bacterium]|nr:sugar ABC transporter permease [Clostridia bacterium]
MKNNTSTNKKSFWTIFKKDFIRNKFLYLMFLPIILYFVIFHYMPMYGVLMAFQDYSPRLGISGSKWVGFANFIEFFRSPSFWIVLRNTVKISFASLVFGFPAPVILALLLNEVRSNKLGRVVQNITYLPHFISLVVVCGLVHMFTRDTGIIGHTYNALTGSKGAMLNNPSLFLPIYIISNIWKEMGWGSIIYLAALLGIDNSLYEAAEIDGAGRWKQTLHVTIPGILPTFVIMLIMRLGQVLGVGYEKILLLYNSSTMDVADVISTYVYRRGLIDQSWSYSAAVGLFNSAVNLIFLSASNFISKKVNGYALW